MLPAGAIVDDSVITMDGRAVPRPLGVITKWFNVQYPIQAVSTYHDFSGLPKRDFYQSIHLIDANIDEFEVKVDNNIIRQDTKAGNEARLAAHGMLPAPTATATPYNLAADIPTRSMVDVVFDHDDKVSSSLPMRFNGRRVGDFNFRISTTTVVRSVSRTATMPPGRKTRRISRRARNGSPRCSSTVWAKAMSKVSSEKGNS